MPYLFVDGRLYKQEREILERKLLLWINTRFQIIVLQLQMRGLCLWVGEVKTQRPKRPGGMAPLLPLYWIREIKGQMEPRDLAQLGG